MIIYADKKMEKRIQTIDEEISKVKQIIDNTYDINKQIQLSKCLTELYKLKKRAMGLK